MHSTILWVVSAAAATAAPLTPLKTPDGRHIADWQPLANPKKPYIAQLYAPAVKPLPVLEDSPADHVHHHGLMFALGGDGTDFWTETGAPNIGTQQPAGYRPLPAGNGYTQSLRWLAADGTHLLSETRTICVRVAGTGADAVHWLDWQSVLTPAPERESVKLSGSHYFGLGMRFDPRWSNHGAFLWQNTKGQTVVRGDEKLTPGRWCAVTHTVDGQPVTVLMLSHPDNPRPGAWFTMTKPFCYLSATYDLEKNPFVLTRGTSWTLRHGLAVMAHQADHAALAETAQLWLKIPPPIFSTAPEPTNPTPP